MNNIFTALMNNLDIDGLEKLADELDRTARRARELAQSARARRDTRAAAEERHLLIRQGVERAASLIDHRGYDIGQAIERVAEETGIGSEAFRRAFGDYIKRRDEHARTVRRIVVSRLAAKGWSNKSIADELGVHPNTVAKDIGAIFRRAKPEPPSPEETRVVRSLQLRLAKGG